MTMTRTTRTFLHSALHPALLPNSPSTFLSNFNLPLIHLTSFSKPVLHPALLITFSCLSISSGTMLYQFCSHFLMSSTYSFLLASFFFILNMLMSLSLRKRNFFYPCMTPFLLSSLPRGLRSDLTFSFSFVPQPPAV